MSSLHLTNVSFSYSDSVPLLQSVDLQLERGWTGVVGANGAGKTTLLRLAAGELTPETGTVRVVPPDGALSYCPQEVGVCSDDVRALAWAAHKQARRLIGELQLVPAELERWDTLSPGERKRWQVAAALAEEPVVLFLDEPTNHLDADARGLLVRTLQRFGGIGLVVSHDRALLEQGTSLLGLRPVGGLGAGDSRSDLVVVLGSEHGQFALILGIGSDPIREALIFFAKALP